MHIRSALLSPWEARVMHLPVNWDAREQPLERPRSAQRDTVGGCPILALLNNGEAVMSQPGSSAGTGFEGRVRRRAHYWYGGARPDSARESYPAAPPRQ